MTKVKNLDRQIYSIFRQKTKLSESRHEYKKRAKEENLPVDEYTKDVIFSNGTLANYIQIAKRLKDYAQALDPNIKHMDEVKDYVIPFLEEKKAEGRSASTLQTYMSAINKLYGTEREDWDIKLPSKNVDEFTNNRGDFIRKYNPKNYQNELRFIQCFGLRKRELRNLKMENIIITKDNIRVVIPPGKEGGAKGGRPRYCDFYGTKEEREAILKDLNDKRLRGFKRPYADFTRELRTHRERQVYANKVYNAHKRDVSTLSKADTITPRKGANKGVKMDVKALELTAKALGHNRIAETYNNYIGL